MARRRSSQPVPVSRLFGRLLPEGYAQKNALIQQLQAFFESQESDAVFQMVTVSNVTDSSLTLSLPNAALASYLRLHGEHIRQQVKEYFGLDLQLKISTRPESSVVQPQKKTSKKFHADISLNSCDQMSNAADYVDDDELKNALKSLSKTLSRDKVDSQPE